jgi:hypothetical protein
MSLDESFQLWRSYRVSCVGKGSVIAASAQISQLRKRLASPRVMNHEVLIDKYVRGGPQHSSN